MKKAILKYKRYIAYRKLKKNAEFADQIKVDLKFWDCEGHSCLDCPYKAMLDTCDVLSNILLCLENDDKYVYDYLMINRQCKSAGLKDESERISDVDRESVDILERKYAGA